jgi:hypothetical protein
MVGMKAMTRHFDPHSSTSTLAYSEMRQASSGFNPVYLYPFGLMRAVYWKTDIWRQTGEYASFYRQRVGRGFNAHTEIYVWVNRRGRFVEVAQLGVRGNHRKVVGC